MIPSKEEKDKQKFQTANAIICGGVAVETANTTTQFNEECRNLRITLREQSTANQAALNDKLRSDSNYVGDRSKGVALAYEYEVADVKMGGAGSADWNPNERAELLNSGKVRGVEGHHTNNVADHPELQTDPDNITFYRDRKSHLREGHGGDFRNSSSGPLVDKDKMLKSTNAKRVIKNEAQGLVVAATTGAAIGVADSVICTCKTDGLSVKSITKGLKQSAKPVAKSTGIAVVTYAIGRACSYAFDYILKN